MKKAAVIYWSGTGNTEAMANAVLEGMKSAGADAVLLTASDVDGSAVGGYDAVALGCPAMGSEVLEDMEFEPMFDGCKSSIGGKRALLFLTEHQTLELKEESILKDTRYDLLLVIANQGYTGSIMDAARAAGAGGGTLIHAKGTGMEGAAAFLGVELVNEKELVLIVSRTSQKNTIMKAIMEGANPKAGAIVFSLPVTSVAGIRMLEEDIQDDLL